jgi:hypothetical protein
MATIAEKKLEQGMRVKLANREPTAADPKTLSYYPFFNDLPGVIQKMYADGTVAVTIDRDALPIEIRKRHEQSEIGQRDKWLGGLSEDEREKLTGRQRHFTLKYTVLVGADDVIVDAGAPLLAGASPADPAPEQPRLALEDLTAAELQHLEEIKSRSESK